MSYDDAWKKVDVLINEKGLPKSAIAEVQKLYDRAKKEKNNAQLTKAPHLSNQSQHSSNRKWSRSNYP